MARKFMDYELRFIYFFQLTVKGIVFIAGALCRDKYYTAIL